MVRVCKLLKPARFLQPHVGHLRFVEKQGLQALPGKLLQPASVTLSHNHAKAPLRYKGSSPVLPVVPKT
jgi:hypothetical protein